MAKKGKSHTSLSHLYILVLVVSLTIGLGLPQYGKIFFPLVTFFLGCIFFFSSLKLHVRDVRESTHDFKTISLAIALKLIIFPVVVYYVTRLISPDLALPFLLLGAMPTAMTAPLFTFMAHGKQSFSLVLSIVTSLLAPFSVPFILKFLIDQTISINLIEMSVRLLIIIVLPIALAEGIKYFRPQAARKLASISRPGSLGALGLLLIGIISVHAETIIEVITKNPAEYLIPLIIFFGAIHAVGYLFFLWLPFKKRIAATVSIAYMNFTLAIYLSSTFFPQEKVLIPIIIASLPWSIAIIPFAEFAARHEHS